MDNDRVSEQDILSGHFQATAQRFATTDGPILALQDTTTHERERPELIGYAGSAITSAQRRGRAKPSPHCGILMHSTLAATAQGLLLEQAAIKFWRRKEFEDTAARRSKVNFTCIPIEESFRWIENLRQSTTRLGDADLARVNDPPPGNKVIWSGMHRLVDIQIGYWLGRENSRWSQDSRKRLLQSRRVSSSRRKAVQRS